MSCSIVEVFELSSASKNPSPHVGAFAESVLEGGHSFLFSNSNEFFYRLGRIIVQFSEQSCRARLATLRGSTNRGLETLRRGAESGINTSAEKLRVSVEDAFNTLIPTLVGHGGNA